MSTIKHSYDRILEISDDHKQITLPDSRFYRRNGNYYPSVTYVLSYYPKGKFFEDWLKKVGYASEYIVKKAAEEGTQTHGLIEKYLTGEKIDWLDEKGSAICSSAVWQMLLKFVEFWETQNPTIISGSEGNLYYYASSSYFEPYITTVGLYNENQDLLAVAKLSQPLPSSTTTDTNIIIKLDT